MDAPNAPNPANPNAQDQIVDAAQGPANQAQGPAVQNQAQGPTVQNQAQGPANNNAQVGQNVPMQPLQQPAPAQPVPAGPVVPALQVFYQNWIGKKPEFSGKPEEDAESHLLSTRDWMEAHNFPDEVKVRRFCLTLTGEARLWYESLAPLDNDWPALQNKFRWQYSKIGNTPEQLFHAWRTFKFDENTDTIDSYVLRMSQVAAMLNYGEMQILENFKNTLPYRLYSTLINVNNLRDAIDLAKRVLTKEKLDRQLTGQSSTPFMRMTNNENHAVPNNNKRGVTFDAMETLERNSDCIDKLTSLVSDMKMTMDRKQSSYKPRIYQGRSRNQNRNQQNFMPRNRFLAEEEIKVEIEEIIIIEITTDPITETDQEADGTIIGQVIGVAITRLTIDVVIIDQITDKMLNRHSETEVKVEIELKITIMTIREVEVEKDTMTDLFSQDKTHYLMEEMNLGPDPIPG